MSNNPTMIILAGGANSRFWPLREKSLYPFMGETLLEKQLKVYHAAGFDRAIIIANPDNRPLVESVLGGLNVGMDAGIVVQREPLGMGHAIMQAAPLLEGMGYPPIYICQVNDVVEPDLHEDLMTAYRSGRAVSYVTGYQVESYFPGGYLSVESDGRITGIIEKPGAGNEPSDLVSVVAHIHTDSRQLLQRIQTLYDAKHPRDDHYEMAMAAMMEATRFECVRYDGEWYPIKYPWHVLNVMKFYLSKIEGQQIHPDAKINGQVSITGDVMIEAGARLFHGAAVVGPAYIGPGAIIGNGALVRESMVGPKCMVGHVSEVARSYLGQNVNLHRAVVLDSVFEDYVNFSAGCITANLRIDHGTVKSTVKGDRLDSGRDKLGAMVGVGAFIGIQSGTMPGIKIGAGAEIGPFTNVTEDVREGERFYVPQEARRVEATGKVQP
ncbi:MAG: NTP transferase domain-containing protein [Anaerolineae bacterium]|nr:NTP transferase domain-containing protein [Anaerolineae bacterium]